MLKKVLLLSLVAITTFLNAYATGDGNQKETRVTIVTTEGTIKVKLQKKTGNHLHGEIILPDRLTGIYIWNGERKYLYGGINIIN